MDRHSQKMKSSLVDVLCNHDARPNERHTAKNQDRNERDDDSTDHSFANFCFNDCISTNFRYRRSVIASYCTSRTRTRALNFATGDLRYTFLFFV